MAEVKTEEIIEIEPDEDGGARYRLPYGIAKGLGLNTDGMTPREVWNMLKGKGINPKNAYEELGKKATQEIETDKPVEKKAKLSTREEIETWAKQKGVTVAGNLFAELPENVAVDQSSKFTELYEEFPAKSAGKMSLGINYSLGKGTCAAANFNPINEDMSIGFSKAGFLEEDEKEIGANIESGWWCKIPPENYKYQTITHEYGHIVEYTLLSRLGYAKAFKEQYEKLKNDAYFDWRLASKLQANAKKLRKALRKELFYDRVFPKIFEKAKEYDSTLVVPKKITAKGYETAPQVSRYGTTNWAEYFAESFTSGMLGGDNAVGKATVDVVRSIFKGEIEW